MLFVLNEAKDLRSIPSWSIAQRKIGRDPSHSLRMTESFNLTRNKHMRKTLTFVIAALIAAPALVYSETMKAIVAHEFGGPEVLKLGDVPRPEPKENEILIKVIAAGVNAKALSTYMGHATISITLDRYGHLMPGNEAEAAGLLDAYLEGQMIGAGAGRAH